MVEFEISRLSSKGQIVIPTSMRKDLKEGDKIIFIKDKKSLILKKASEMDENFKEDLEFARRTEKAYKRIEAGEGRTMEFDKFIEEIKKW
jgi:AbrB family looped-hinge helix DNA binding protein